MELPMSTEEICVRYRQAKDKGDQVIKLSELNDCPIERIIGILVANGVDNRNFNILRHKLKINKEFEEKEIKKASDKKQKKKAEVAEKMQETLYGEEKKVPYKKPEIIPPPFPPKQQGFKDIDLIEVGECIYEDRELVDAFGKKIHALIDHRKELVAELDDIDKQLALYVPFINDIREALTNEGISDDKV